MLHWNHMGLSCRSIIKYGMKQHHIRAPRDWIHWSVSDFQLKTTTHIKLFKMQIKMMIHILLYFTSANIAVAKDNYE